MSNVLRNHFFTVSRELVDGGHLAALPGSAVKLYITLMMLAQKHSAVELEVPAYLLHDLAGLSANTLTSASKQLEQAGLVKCRDGRYGRKSYVLLDPKTGYPLPAPKGFKGVFCPPPTPERGTRTAKKRIRPVASSETAIPSWDEIAEGEQAAQYRKNCEPSTRAGPQKLRTTSTDIGNHDPNNCGPSRLEVLETEAVGLPPSSLNQSLKREVSEPGELSKIAQGYSTCKTLPCCRVCGSYALYRDRSGRVICQTCEDAAAEQ
jgi:hypothetical protein